MCNTKDRTPHKHRDLIRAWADGAKIEYYDGRKFIDCPYNRPEWRDNVEYRIKPEPSDLEKYGVQVGDVWLLEEANLFSNALIVTIADECCRYIIVGSGRQFTCNVKKSLLSHGDLVFRRGVVNKL